MIIIIAESKLAVEESNLAEVLEVLKDAAENIGNDDDDDDDNNDNDNDIKNKQKEMLMSWCYSLEKVLGLEYNDNTTSNDDTNDTTSHTNDTTTTENR